MRAKPKTTYVTASPQTWELIRAAYLSGLSAPTAAARFGVSVSALRKRAAREGWTKQAFAAAHPGALPARACAPAGAPAPPPGPARDPALAGIDAIAERYREPADLTPEQVARRALGLAARAVAEGRAGDAERLARAARAVAALEMALPPAGWDDGDYAHRDLDGRDRYMREMAVTVALNLAERLARGDPLPEEFEKVRRERGEGLGTRDA